MLQPDLQTFKAQIEDFVSSGSSINTFVVSKSILAETLSPQTAYLKIAKPGSADAARSFMFESAIKGQHLSRYSFIGANPRKTLITGPGTELGEVDPLTVLEKELASFNAAAPTFNLPGFSGGSVGYVSYDCVRYFEPKTARDQSDPVKVPEAVLMLFDTIVAFDNVFQRIHVMHNIHSAGALAQFDAKSAYAEAEKAVDATIKLLNGPEYTVPQKSVTPNSIFKSNIGQEGYENHVRTLKKHILAGDIIQAVPSQRIKHETDLHPFNIYRQLRTVNPSPYMFYLDLLDFQIIGASPEVLAKIDNGRVIVHPIAGTVKRGNTAEEDDELCEGLLKDEKERAEHVMLVDLARNDINRVCKPETSKVDKFMVIERFSHVSHITSECSGRLRDDKTRFDALRSIFPAGTVSGAPKVKAMELIAEIEGERRGVYAGCVGLWGYEKSNMDTCIALRTMTYKEGSVYIQAGGGIVHDSDPTAEFMETENKAKANKSCLMQAEELWASRG